LLHCLAREAEARGHTVRLIHRDHNGLQHDHEGLHGLFVIAAGDSRSSLWLEQLHDAVPHEATPQELARAKRENWYRIPQFDSVPSGRLKLTLHSANRRYHSKQSWSDSKAGKISLEVRLPDVFTTLERWAQDDVDREEADRVRAIEARERREREDALVVANHREHTLSTRLLADLEQWELARRLAPFLEAMASHVAGLEDPVRNEAGAEWLQWCEDYARRLDPLARDVVTPRVSAPGYEEMAAAKKRLGLRDGYW
jgi:hypothetical protein